MRPLLRTAVLVGIASAVIAAGLPTATAASLSTGPVSRAVAGEGAVRTTPTVSHDWQARMLARVNAVRASAGVPPVRVCPSLNRSAGAYARTMARTDYFGHIGRDGKGPGERITAAGYRWRLAAENIAAGQHTVYEAMQGWRGSPTHLATIMDPRYTDVGFGYATFPGSTYTRYWVQDFGDGRC